MKKYNTVSMGADIERPTCNLCRKEVSSTYVFEKTKLKKLCEEYDKRRRPCSILLTEWPPKYLDNIRKI